MTSMTPTTTQPLPPTARRRPPLLFVPLAAGTIFGAGLAISAMVDPRRVLGFLDMSGLARGRWDPTLLAVFAGALAVMCVAYRVARDWRRPMASAAFHGPTALGIDGKLVGGATLFGLGWGLVGICPGPALAALPLASGYRVELAVFIAAMVGGMALVKRFGA